MVRREIEARPARPRIQPSFVAFVLLCAAGTAMAATAKQAPPTRPDLGPNVLIFDPSMPAAAVQEQIDKVYAIEQKSEFGSARYALLFLPGKYHVDLPVGFYTQVLGLGGNTGRRRDRRQRSLRRERASQQCHLHVLAGRGGICGESLDRNDAVGSVARGPVPPDAHTRRSGLASEPRMGQRGMDV
jgi:hypothetical protein